MNKLILSLPKSILTKYVIKNFSKLSVEDFFQVAPKINIPLTQFRLNDKLYSNSDVLKYMLDVNGRAFQYFKQESLNTECVNKIADLGVEIYPNNVEEYPQLLENDTIREQFIGNFPKEIKRLSAEQITKRVIEALEKTNYVIDEEDVKKQPLFLEIESFIRSSIANNPNFILQVKNVSEKLVTTALRNGFVPTKEHFYINPQLRNYEMLLSKALEQDPSVIVFYDRKKLTPSVISLANKKGYIAEEHDLLENPDLTHFSQIMTPAIRNNPKLITLVAADCILSYDFVIETLQKYKITKEDIEKNPAITRNYSVIQHLREFKSYSAFLTDQEKEDILLNCFNNSKPITTEECPFLSPKYGGKTDIKKLTQLINYLQLSLDENNISVQENYFQTLDKVVDGIVNIRYEKNKFSFKYPDIVALNDGLIQLFEVVATTKDYNQLSQFTKELHLFVGETIKEEEIADEVSALYHIYSLNGSVDLSITNEFCNRVLNQHRNHFMSAEKAKIINKIKPQMDLTEKKKNTILNGKKIIKIGKLIEVKAFQQLGITDEQFKVALENVKAGILNNKDIKKSGVSINESHLDTLISYYRYYGKLTPDMVYEVLNIQNEEIAKYIANKFEQIKFKLLNNVTLTENEAFIYDGEKNKIGGLNPNNYKIGDKNRYFRNLAALLIKMDEERVNKILNNKELIGEVANLLPLLGLIEELDVETFINILCDYERIRTKIYTSNNRQPNIDNGEFIFQNIADLIYLANAYSSVDDITLCALGRSVVSVLEEHNSPKYLDFYRKMLNKTTGKIPPISVQTSDYYLQSGNYSDEERLLIGKKPKKDSCIDLLNSAGAATYNEVLLQETGDVILIRDKQNKLVSRILIFRRGNVVQMVSSSGENLPMEFYQQIADQIIAQAISAQDNIDYVFVNSLSSTLENSGYIKVQDRGLVDKFPHADFSDSAILLQSKSKVQGYIGDKLSLNFDEQPKASYMKPRKKISYNPKESEITRLRALAIVMNNDQEIKENKSREFEPFYAKEYEKVLCGEDWYIAIKQDGETEELVLPSTDHRTYEEIEEIKESLGLVTGNNKTI